MKSKEKKKPKMALRNEIKAYDDNKNNKMHRRENYTKCSLGNFSSSSSNKVMLFSEKFWRKGKLMLC